MIRAPACPATHPVAGQRVACAEPPQHRGPHAGPGRDGVAGAAWCDLPCQGRLCRGPCHDGDPGGGTRSSGAATVRCVASDPAGTIGRMAERTYTDCGAGSPGESCGTCDICAVADGVAEERGGFVLTAAQTAQFIAYLRAEQPPT